MIFVSNTVFIFSPSSSKPVYTIAKMNSSEPVAAVFIPRPNPLAKGPEWLVNSRLLIVDDKQVRSLVFLTFDGIEHLIERFNCRTFSVWMTLQALDSTRN